MTSSSNVREHLIDSAFVWLLLVNFIFTNKRYIYWNNKHSEYYRPVT